MPGLSLLALAMACSAVAGVLRIRGGFGYSLLVFPFVASSFGAPAAFALCVVMEIVIGSAVLMSDKIGRRIIDLRITGMAATALLAALIFNRYLGPRVDHNIAYIAGLTASATGGLVLLLRPALLPANWLTAGAASASSGILGVVCGVSGPPILLLLFGDPKSTWAQIRASLTSYFFILYLGILLLRWPEIVAQTRGHLPVAGALATGLLFALLAAPNLRENFSAKTWAGLSGMVVLLGCALSLCLRMGII